MNPNQAPNVQSIEQIISDLNPAYSGSEAVIAQRRASLPGQFQSQRMGLQAEKVQGFNQINNQATGRGMSFSGIPLDEQANYLSTKFLPGMQQLQFQENEAGLALDDALAKINQERRLKAMDIRQTQQSSLEKYLAEERERAWQQQRFQAEQAMERAKMSQQASIAAADRAAQYSSGSSTAGMVGSIAATFQKKKGKDNFVSPDTFRSQMQSWMSAGGSPDAFIDAFGGYVNPVHQKRFGGYY